MKSNINTHLNNPRGLFKHSQFLKRRRVLTSIKTWKFGFPSITSVLVIKNLLKEAYNNKGMWKKNLVLWFCVGFWAKIPAKNSLRLCLKTKNEEQYNTHTLSQTFTVNRHKRKNVHYLHPMLMYSTQSFWVLTGIPFWWRRIRNSLPLKFRFRINFCTA